MLTITELDITKLKSLLLNKVKNLKWHYFDIDLNDQTDADYKVCTNPEEFNTLFDQIVRDFDDKFIFNGETQNDHDKMIISPVLAAILEKPQILKEVSKRIFDLNAIDNNSESDEGRLGKLNKISKEKRNKTFMKNMRNGFRKKKDHYTVLAEGDSWFEYPPLYMFGRKVVEFVVDILDHLIRDDNYSVYSLAAGGDWLSNILYSGEYIEELPIIAPDVFLISGGGNDLVGGNRLATMVRSKTLHGSRDINNLEKPLQRLLNMRINDESIDIEQYKMGLCLLSDEFFEFMNVCFVQYFIFFHNLILNTDKYKNLLFITQGYDFAIPSNQKMKKWYNIKQTLVNSLNDTGQWLHQPLSMKGITDETEQKAVVYTIIYEFNEMLIQLASFEGFPNVFHIDCRGAASESDWYDELHLNSNAFKRVANIYKKVIVENAKKSSSEMVKKKVYKVV